MLLTIYKKMKSTDEGNLSTEYDFQYTGTYTDSIKELKCN